MKKLLAIVCGVISSVCFGWGLDSVTKAVDKAAEVADKVEEVKKVVTEQPQTPAVQAPAAPVVQTPTTPVAQAAAAPVTQPVAARYDLNRKGKLRINSNQEIDLARHSGDITIDASNELQQWVSATISGVNSIETEDAFKSEFAQKLTAAKNAQAKAKTEQETKARVESEKAEQERKRMLAAQAERKVQENQRRQLAVEAEGNAKRQSEGEGRVENVHDRQKVAGAENATAEKDFREGKVDRTTIVERKITERTNAVVSEAGEREPTKSDSCQTMGANSGTVDGAVLEDYKLCCSKIRATYKDDNFGYEIIPRELAKVNKFFFGKNDQTGYDADASSRPNFIVNAQDSSSFRSTLVAALTALKYIEKECDREEFLDAEKSLTPEHKEALIKLLKDVTQEQLATFVRERNDWLLFAAAQLITDQKVLENLLATDEKWVHGGYRDNLMCSDFRTAYYRLYRNVTDQDLLMKLLKQAEISFSTDSCTAYGYRDSAVFRQLDKEHLAMLNRQRVARRRAAQGKTVDVLGFYIGMPYQDFELIKFCRGLTDDDVRGGFGTWKNGSANRLWFNHKYCATTMGIKDGIVSLALFTAKFVPGGESAAGDINVNGDVRDSYDIAKEEVNTRVDAYWWRACPALGCTIKLYEGGNLVIEADEKDVKMDLSAAEKWMNDDFDETELDNPNGSSSGGGFFTLIILLALACGGLYFFRAKIDAFVVKNPKYQKTWMLTCKAGTTAKELSLKAKGLVQEKFAKKN